jgi:transketolase
VINAEWPETIGGSADLTAPTTPAPRAWSIAPGDFAGRYIHYGIREHGMAAAMNGMALHGGIIPYSRHLPGVLRLLPARRSGSPR